MKIKNMLDRPLWVPASIKPPADGAPPGSLEAAYGLLQPGEEVDAPEDAVNDFARIAGDRVSVR